MSTSISASEPLVFPEIDVGHQHFDNILCFVVLIVREMLML